MPAQPTPPPHRRDAATALGDSYLLVANSVLSAGLGMLFWVVAARQFDPAEVAAAGSTLALIALLADVSLLELPSAATRYLAAYPSHRATLVKRAYMVVAATTSVAGLVFVSLPSDGALGAIDRGDVVWFAFFWVLLIAIPGLHDGILVGIGRTAVVPIKNLLFGVGKLGLLIVFAGAGWSDGILGAWMLAGIVVAIPTAALIARSNGTTVAADGVDWREVRRFATQHYVAGLLMMTWAVVPPILVTAWSDDAVGAAFFVSWTIGLISMTAVDAFMRPLTVLRSTPGESVADVTWRYIVAAWTRALPVLVVLMVAAPLVMSVFGAGYRAEGTTVLRWLLVAVAVQVPVAAAVAEARGRGDHRRLLTIGLGIAPGTLVVPIVMSGIDSDRDVGVWFAAALAVSHGVVALITLRGTGRVRGARRSRR